MSSSPYRHAALQALVWTVSAAAAGGSLLLLGYEWVRSTGQLFRLTVLSGWHAGRPPDDPWLLLLGAIALAACFVQVRLVRAVRLRQRLVDQVSPYCSRGRWGLARLLRGARAWPELLSAACLLIAPLTLALLLQRARDRALQVVGAWWDPRDWASALNAALHLQLTDLVLGGALCVVAVAIGTGVLLLLLTWRLRINALREAVRVVRAKERSGAHPYRGALLTDAAAMEWIAAPGPGSRTAVLGAAAFCALSLAPAWWAVARYAAEFFVDLAYSSTRETVLEHLTSAEAQLANGLVVAGLGALVCWAAGLAVFASWQRGRLRAATGGRDRPAPSMRPIAAVALASTVLTALALPLALQYRDENAMSFPRIDRRLGSPPGVRPDDFPYVTAFDPVITVHQDRFEVDGAALDQTSTLGERLSQYRHGYPAWAAGQGRFVVVAARRDTPMWRVREALHAAREAGYELAYFPAEHDCRVARRPVLGDLWDCRVSTGRIALGGEPPHTGPWQAALFGEFSERVMASTR